MTEDDLFGVQDPESSEIAFCCIMGSWGEHRALAAYLGAFGLSTLYQLADTSNMYVINLRFVILYYSFWIKRRIPATKI